MRKSASYRRAAVFVVAIFLVAGVVRIGWQKREVQRQEIFRVLRDTDRLRRLNTLRALEQENPEVLKSALLSGLAGNDPQLKSRAARALALLSFKQDGDVVSALAAHLQIDADPVVRLSCAIGLMSVKAPQVQTAYIHAVKDKSEKVAQIACIELGSAGGPQATTALFETLSSPSWQVRLEACKALITLKAADARVVSTLQEMAKEPEAKKYDAEIETFQREDQRVGLGSLQGTSFDFWGKIGTILDKAQKLAAHKR